MGGVTTEGSPAGLRPGVATVDLQPQRRQQPCSVCHQRKSAHGEKRDQRGPCRAARQEARSAMAIAGRFRHNSARDPGNDRSLRHRVVAELSPPEGAGALTDLPGLAGRRQPSAERKASLALSSGLQLQLPERTILSQLREPIPDVRRRVASPPRPHARVGLRVCVRRGKDQLPRGEWQHG